MYKWANEAMIFCDDDLILSFSENKLFHFTGNVQDSQVSIELFIPSAVPTQGIPHQQLYVRQSTEYAENKFWKSHL